MSNLNCRACLVSCMDFRLHEQLRSFLFDQGLDKDGADIVRVAGAARGLARPRWPAERAALLDQVKTSVGLHRVQQIHVINHEDCGAYGEEAVTDSADELQLHAADLRATRDLLHEAFPQVEVLTWFMWLDGKTDPIP